MEKWVKIAEIIAESPKYADKIAEALDGSGFKVVFSILNGQQFKFDIVEINK